MRKYSAVGGIHFGNRVHLRRYGGKKKDQRTASRGAQTAKSSLEMCAYFLLFCLSKKGEELAEWRLASDKKKKTEIPQLRHQFSVDCSIVHRADGEK